MTDRLRLGDVCRVQNGFAFDADRFDKEHGTPLIRIRDLKTNDPSVRFDGAYDPSYVVRKGDLLIGMDGEFKPYRWGGPDALLNQRVCRLIPEPDILDIGYLRLAIANHLKDIEDATGLTTVKHLSSRQIADIQILLPAPKDQLLVAQRLTAQLTEIDHARAIAQSSLGYIQSLGEALWRPESDWMARRVPLRDISRSIEYGWTASASPSPEWPRLLRITDIQDGLVNWDQVPHSNSKPSDSKILRDGDVVVARTGGTTGKSYLITNPPSAVFASYLLRVAPRPELDSLYLYGWMKSADYWYQVALAARGGAQPNLNATQLGNFTIPLPSIDDQRRFALEWQDQHATTLAIRHAVQMQVSELLTLRATILRQTFSGLGT